MIWRKCDTGDSLCGEMCDGVRSGRKKPAGKQLRVWPLCLHLSWIYHHRRGLSVKPEYPQKGKSFPLSGGVGRIFSPPIPDFPRGMKCCYDYVIILLLCDYVTIILFDLSPSNAKLCALLCTHASIMTNKRVRHIHFSKKRNTPKSSIITLADKKNKQNRK